MKAIESISKSKLKQTQYNKLAHYIINNNNLQHFQPMSSLSNQLKSIKIAQNSLKIGPNQQQPSILFDKYTARTTSIDTIYSMAILAYDRLQSSLSNSMEEVHNREELLGEGLKEVNRNTMTKEENAQLSRKLERFVIELAPFLLNSECQQVLEYLLRNFKVNVFETEVLVLALLPYWNYEIYQKVIETVSKKQMTGKLTFLNQMVSTQQINFAFILKTLTFSHAIIDRLISIVLQGSLLELKTSADHMIHLTPTTTQQAFLKHPLKNFLLKIFLTLIKEKRTTHYKYIIDFCSSCLRIKYPDNQRDDKFEIVSGVLVLVSNLLVDNGVSDEYVLRTVQRLVRKFVVGHGGKLAEKSLKQVFDFVMLVWQRKTHLIDREIIETLSADLSFCKYLKSSPASKYMIFHHLWNALCHDKVKCEALLETIGINIKTEEFYRLHETHFLSQAFETVEKTFSEIPVDQQQRKWLCNFLQQNFKQELGSWINERQSSGKAVQQSLITSIFSSQEINPKTGKILLQRILKVQPQKKPENKIILGIERMKIQEQKEESEEEQEGKDQAVQNQVKSKKLVELLRTRGVSIENEIDFSDETTKSTLIQLFIQSYTEPSLLTFHQKVLIVQKYSCDLIATYTPANFTSDLTCHQFAVPVKLFSLTQQPSTQQPTLPSITLSFSLLQQLFTFILSNKNQLQNLLFKQVIRLCLNKLISLTKTKYKQVVTFLHKYYKKMSGGCKGLIEFVQVSGFLLKVSERVFGVVGNNKGKYQSLIHTHCKLLSILINNMSSHQFQQNNPIITPTLLHHTYHQILSIFGAKQLYLINTGVIELITRKELNYQQLKFFIDEIMLKEINFEIDTQKESNVGVDYYEHVVSVGKCLIFSSFMLGSGEQEWVGAISPILTSGIARNQVAIFYGLVKDKLKRNIVRKLFLFFKLTFESKRFVEGFKTYLTTLNDQQMRKLLHIYSQVYYVLLSIDIRDDPKIQSVIEKLLDRITNLFSLDLRLTLFRPLLPNVKLYSYLNAQLKVHKQADFEQLSELINITPDELSTEWVNFLHECLKRGHPLSPSTAEAIFTNPHFLNDQSNFQTYCELTCHLSQYPQSRDSLIPYINQCMNIVLAVCQTDPNHDYCLSILYKIITNLKELVDPFVGEVFRYALECESEFVGKFIEETVQGLTLPTLIEAVKTLSKTSKHLFNFGVFFKHVCKHGVGHLLSKTLQYYASKIIHSSIQDQVDLSNLYTLASEIFLQMTLKFNENELRKVLIDFVRWSEVKQNEEIAISFNMRKIFIASVFCKLSASLGGLFTPFYGYVFDSYLKDLDLIVGAKVEKLKDGGKRLRSESGFSDQVTLTYLTKVLESLSLLFQKDAEKEFLDSTKFDLLSERLSNLFTIERLSPSEYTTLASTLSTCLLHLCQYLTDDYQLKSLNLKILLLLRHKVPRQQQAIFTFMDKLIDQIQDRYLLFINDLVPFLIDNVHNRNEKVKAPIRSIISKFEEMSGSKIENYMR